MGFKTALCLSWAVGQAIVRSHRKHWFIAPVAPSHTGDLSKLTSNTWLEALTRQCPGFSGCQMKWASLTSGSGTDVADHDQLLIHVLSLFRTDTLLGIVPVCHRFQNIILHIVHSRLLLAASLKDLKLILECYHPSAQYTEPYLFCEYLGTPGLSDEIEGEGFIYPRPEQNGRLGRLRGIYSRFRPTPPDADPPFRSHPAGDIPGSWSSLESPTHKPPEVIELVTQSINIDAQELFSQLCVSANLVRIGPRRGVFLSCIDVLRKTTPRVWRHWLAERAESSKTSNLGLTDLSNDRDSERIVWVDNNKNVGIRVRVQERRWRSNMPVLVHKDDDQAVSYSLELEGKSITLPMISSVFDM